MSVLAAGLVNIVNGMALSGFLTGIRKQTYQSYIRVTKFHFQRYILLNIDEKRFQGAYRS